MNKVTIKETDWLTKLAMEENIKLTKAQKVAQWRLDNPEKYREQQKRWRDKMKTEQPERLALMYRKRNYRNKYGISLEIFEEMLKEQEGVCYLCKNPNTHGRHLAVDHCHKSGKVRKLLCTPCNLTVEHLENALAPLERYIDYIKDHARL